MYERISNYRLIIEVTEDGATWEALRHDHPAMCEEYVAGALGVIRDVLQKNGGDARMVRVYDDTRREIVEVES